MSLAPDVAMTTQLPSVVLTIDGKPSPHRVVAVAGSEAISSLFEFDVTLAADEELADPPAIGARASIAITYATRTRTIFGIVRAFEEGESVGTPILSRVTIAPSAVVLALREDCRVFQAKSAPDVIEAVLLGAGFGSDDYRLVLQSDYAAREHTVQYRESDWTFLSRLMEAEGIHCFFDHDGEREVLVFADSALAHPKMSEPASLPFRAADGALRGGERATRFRLVEELRAGSVALSGHDFRAPRAMLASRATDGSAAPGIYDAPPEYDAASEGDRLAKLRLEQEVARSAVARAVSDCLGIKPGTVFDLKDHGRENLNRSWLVQSVEHRFAAAEYSQEVERTSYENHFVSIPSDIPFRSRTRTVPPRIGIQTAVVIGPVGQEIHCDELGRVKVRFYWDRLGQADERAASWIRVSQTWAGAGNGAVFIPRVGDEVLVDFAGGDCDRPIIVGSVYNAANVPPLNLPEERTAALIRATSTPGGEGQSELRIEAASGRERVYLQSHRNLDLRAGHDKTESVARHEGSTVGGNRTRVVGGVESIGVGGDRSVGVGGDQSVTVGGDLTTGVGGNDSLAVGGDRSVDVTGQSTVIVGEHLKIKVGGNKTENVIGLSREAVAGEKALEAERYALTVHDEIETAVGGDHTEKADGTRRIVAGERVELICGEAKITAHRDGTITLEGKRIQVKSAGTVEVEGDRLSVKTSGSVRLAAAGVVKVRGRGIGLN
jgi:type VI secretion system secreted protein VgrG